MLEKPQPKKRRTRRDKGTIQATERDQACLAWIAEQYAARFEQVQRLLTRYPDPHNPFKGKLISEATTRDTIDRWTKAGWAEYERVLAAEKGYVWITKRGLELVELDELFKAKQPAATRLHHVYAVNQLRLWMELQGHTWTSERRYRAELDIEKGESPGPIPDAIVRSDKAGKVAIEVELTPKKPEVLYQKFENLVNFTHFSLQTARYINAFPVIWVYVPDDKMKKAVEVAFGRLTDTDRRRVSVGIETDLRAI
jgi:hypothetical protein